MGRTHSRLGTYLFGVLVLVILGYAFFEAQNILYGPRITLSHGDSALAVNTEMIELTGTVKNVVDISLGGRSITIDDTGVFAERLLLAEGVNRFTFIARDRFGRTNTEHLEVVYIPLSPPQRQLDEPDMIEERDALEDTSNEEL